MSQRYLNVQFGFDYGYGVTLYGVREAGGRDTRVVCRYFAVGRETQNEDERGNRFVYGRSYTL